MPTSSPLTTNFAQLQERDEQLVRLGMLAERYFSDDPNTSLSQGRNMTSRIQQPSRPRGRHEGGAASASGKGDRVIAASKDAAERLHRLGILHHQGRPGRDE